MDKTDLKNLIIDFIENSLNEGLCNDKKVNARYKNKIYEDLEVKVSFGICPNAANVSWIAFLGFDQKVSNGLYPVILFDRKDCLVLAYGVSKKETPSNKWPSEIGNKYELIENMCKCNIEKIKKQYGESHLKKCYKIVNKGLNENDLNDLINELDDMIKDYKSIFENLHNDKENNKEKNDCNCLKNSNLKLEENIINSFYNSLKTKGFVILAGISGSGKTKIFEEFVKCFGNRNNSLFYSIRPDFRDTKSLLGFYNPLTNEYKSTPLLDFMLNASKNYIENGEEADPFFVLFDEMNLARVEYYFADFLSILEVKRFENINEVNNKDFENFVKKLYENNQLNIEDKINEKNYKFTSYGIKLHNENIINIPQQLFLPPNLYFVGTVNIDETTHMFSPKVLDRAFTIEFDVGDFKEYYEFLSEEKNNNKENSVNSENCKNDFTNKGEFAFINKDKIKEFCNENNKYVEKLNNINQILRKYNLHFGYRVFDEIIMFLYNSKGSLNLNEAFDLAIKMKVLPKFHGTRQQLWNPIIDLIKELKREDEKNSIENEKLYLEVEHIRSIPILEESNINIETDDGTFLIETDYKYTLSKLLEILYKLKIQGFASFM